MAAHFPAPLNRIDPNGEHWYYLWIDDLIEAVDELMASVSNIVYGRAAYERSYYDPKGAIYGFDYCWWPNGASAYSFTIGTSCGVYGGYDYYWCLD